MRQRISTSRIIDESQEEETLFNRSAGRWARSLAQNSVDCTGRLGPFGQLPIRVRAGKLTISLLVGRTENSIQVSVILALPDHVIESTRVCTGGIECGVGGVWSRGVWKRVCLELKEGLLVLLTASQLQPGKGVGISRSVA